MKKLLNTLYVTSPDSYLALDGENVVVYSGKDMKGRIPLHTIDSIVTFGYSGASPALIGKCAEQNKQIVFLKENGKFLARCVGKVYGNVLLRNSQFKFTNDDEKTLNVAKNIVSAKILNSSMVLRRALSDHSDRLPCEKIEKIFAMLKNSSRIAYTAKSFDSLRGIEGESANRYFSVFDFLILQQKDNFAFDGRNKRPPLDRVNALLSFGYSLLTSMFTSALETVGLDAYSGVFHTLRPGRCSLALDLLEELRAPLVDRFVLDLINRQEISPKDFTVKENSAVLLSDDGRRKFLSSWQDKKKETIIHPYIQEEVEWGLVPFIQAMLIAKFIRDDIDDYPPFLWR